MTEPTQAGPHPKKARARARGGAPPSGAAPTAEAPENPQLRATVAALRAELERAVADGERAVRRALEEAAVEIGHLRSTVVVLRGDLERAIDGAEAGAREASAASGAVIAQLEESVAALRVLLEGQDLRRGREERARELRHGDECRELRGIIVALRDRLERSHAPRE